MTVLSTGRDGYLHHVYCAARCGNGWGCTKKATSEVETDQRSVPLCKTHRGVLGTRGGITLKDGNCIVSMPGGYRIYPAEMGTGVQSS
jgi:hypothetical protein